MKANNRVDIMGVGFDDVDLAEAVEIAERNMAEGRGAYVCTPNPEIVMCCREDGEAMEAVNGACLVIPDGVGVVYASRMMKTPLKAKVPGIDLCSALISRLAARGGSLFLLGAKPGVAEKAAEKLLDANPGLVIAGTNDGYFSDSGPVIEKINAARPDLMLVCLGAPKQEKWMHNNAPALDVGLMIGAGGSLDVFAGEVKRAPDVFCRLGLEWMYRLIKEPSRIGRMAVLPKFMLKAAFGRQK